MTLRIGEAPVTPPVRAPDTVTTPAKPAAASEGPSPFARLVHGLGREMNKGEAMMNAAKHAQDYGPAALLALQAGVYRYSEAVDLAAKLVDRTTSGVKTVLQGSG